MDKTLEIVLVATTLVVAAVVVISMLQGQSDSFGEYSENQRDSSECGVGFEQWKDAIKCTGAGSGDNTPLSNSIEGRYSSCGWANDGSSTDPDPDSHC